MTKAELGAANEEPSRLSLAGEFPTPTLAEWRQRVAQTLSKTLDKNRRLVDRLPDAPEQLLATTIDDGLEIAPLYTKEDSVSPIGFPGLPPFTRGSEPGGAARYGWGVRTYHADPDATAVNQAIVDDLEGGATSVWLHVGDSGVPLVHLPEALAGVYLDAAPVVLDAGPDFEAAARSLIELYEERQLSAADLRGVLGADPIGLRVRTGQPWELAPAAALAASVATRFPGLRTIVVDGLPFHEAGGSHTQELGMCVAAGVAYVRALTAAGLSPTAAASQLEFRFAATVDQFLTIAKFRAARRMWDRVMDVAGIGHTGAMRQHAVTSPAELTRRDPWMNIVRGTVSCFAAGVGGANAVTVLPFDHAIGLSTPRARRLARNTSAILVDESKVASVIDPAGGSWYVENVTEALAERAWREFTSIEGAGGIESAVDSGWLAERIAATRDARVHRLATRTETIIGVSEFPHLDEEKMSRPPRPSNSDNETLPRVRYAQAYETLRDRSDGYLAKHGDRPCITLVLLNGSPAGRTRATFVSDLFRLGGIQTRHVDLDALSGQPTAVCVVPDEGHSTDELNAAIATVHKAGVQSVFLADKPSEHQSKIAGFVYPGCDVPGLLTRVLDAMESGNHDS